MKEKFYHQCEVCSLAGKPIEISPNRLYNCFSKNTQFITTNGNKSFSDFLNGDEIIVPTHTGEFKSAIVRSYGIQKLYKYTFARGKTKKIIFATKNHR